MNLINFMRILTLCLFIIALNPAVGHSTQAVNNDTINTPQPTVQSLPTSIPPHLFDMTNSVLIQLSTKKGKLPVSLQSLLDHASCGDEVSVHCLLEFYKEQKRAETHIAPWLDTLNAGAIMMLFGNLSLWYLGGEYVTHCGLFTPTNMVFFLMGAGMEYASSFNPWSRLIDYMAGNSYQLFANQQILTDFNLLLAGGLYAYSKNSKLSERNNAIWKREKMQTRNFHKKPSYTLVEASRYDLPDYGCVELEAVFPDRSIKHFRACRSSSGGNLQVVNEKAFPFLISTHTFTLNPLLKLLQIGNVKTVRIALTATRLSM